MVSLLTLNQVIDAISLTILSGILISFIFDENRHNRPGRMFLILVSLCLAYQTTDILLINLSGMTAASERFRWILVNSMNVLAYGIVHVFLVFVLSSRGLKRAFDKTLMIGSLCCCIASILSSIILSLGNVGYYFSNGNYYRGDLWYIEFIYPTLALTACFLLIIGFPLPLSRRLLCLTYCISPLVGIFFGYYLAGCSYLGITMALAVLMVYLNIYISRSAELHHIETELADARVETMMSQIQPHFLYNALTSAVGLCRTDPEAARVTLIDFSSYLRGNLNSLKQKTPIPFIKELEHVKTYLRLEKTRFGDSLSIQYHIEATGFAVPALSIQPLVENAVKHGLTERKEGGTLVISSKETDNLFIVEIQDDGVGFDESKLANDGKIHIGMTNVKERLSAMVGGQLHIHSAPGCGTTAIVAIPKPYKQRKKQKETFNTAQELT